MIKKISQLAHKATIHLDNDGSTSKPTPITGTVGPVPVYKNRPASIPSTVEPDVIQNQYQECMVPRSIPTLATWT